MEILQSNSVFNFYCYSCESKFVSNYENSSSCIYCDSNGIETYPAEKDGQITSPFKPYELEISRNSEEPMGMLDNAVNFKE